MPSIRIEPISLMWQFHQIWQDSEGNEQKVGEDKLVNHKKMF